MLTAQIILTQVTVFEPRQFVWSLVFILQLCLPVLLRVLSRHDGHRCVESPAAAVIFLFYLGFYKVYSWKHQHFMWLLLQWSRCWASERSSFKKTACSICSCVQLKSFQTVCDCEHGMDLCLCSEQKMLPVKSSEWFQLLDETEGHRSIRTLLPAFCLFSQKHVPSWLQSTRIYHWPSDTQDLLLRLLREERYIIPQRGADLTLTVRPL